MAITIDDIDKELKELRGIEGDCRSISGVLREMKAALADAPPVWDIIDPTPAQRDAILARYDQLKASLKTKVAAF